MKKKATNYNTLTQLAAFSVGTEGATEDLSDEELDSTLAAHGVDLLKQEAATV